MFQCDTDHPSLSPTSSTLPRALELLSQTFLQTRNSASLGSIQRCCSKLQSLQGRLPASDSEAKVGRGGQGWDPGSPSPQAYFGSVLSLGIQAWGVIYGPDWEHGKEAICHVLSPRPQLWSQKTLQKNQYSPWTGHVDKAVYPRACVLVGTHP